MNITQEYLKEILDYDYETGVFKWRLNMSRTAKKGDEAGSYSHGYIVICLKQKKYRAHSLAWLYMTGEMPNHFIDHINGIRNDNRWTNLRKANNQQNTFNSTKRSTNSTGFKGVVYRKNRGHWLAQATLNYKLIYLGSYHSKEDASAAYNNFCKLNHGDFYRDTVNGA